ncbi:MAG: guanylate kinase [Candidatus Eisenbacteria bacterium]|nr:guanylate kinase [Candidatus Eisenbacteria bacterium]MBU1948317.1 guanylate kinase [Candidatus Eisenbacteria bacterium]
MLEFLPQPFVCVISGPSGVGKTVVCRRLLKRNRGLGRVITVTTREPRGRERPEIDYHFVDTAAFEQKRTSGALLEWATVYDASYGTPKDEVEEYLAQGRIPLLNIDVQGALSIRKALPELAVLIFLYPPDEETLRERLEGRGTDSRETIEKRQKVALNEIALAPKYDYVVINGHLMTCVREVEAILRAEMLRARPSSFRDHPPLDR